MSRAPSSKLAYCALLCVAAALAVNAEIYFEENFDDGECAATRPSDGDRSETRDRAPAPDRRRCSFFSFSTFQIRGRTSGRTPNTPAKSSASSCTAPARSTTMPRPTRAYRRRRTPGSTPCPRSSSRSATLAKTSSSSTRSNTNRTSIAAVDTSSCSTVTWNRRKCTAKPHTKSCSVIIPTLFHSHSSPHRPR